MLFFKTTLRSFFILRIIYYSSGSELELSELPLMIPTIAGINEMIMMPMIIIEKCSLTKGMFPKK